MLDRCARPPTNLPPAAPSTKLGPGDLFEVSVLGEKDLPKEYRVQPDCSIDFPYLDRVQGVCGLEPQELVDKLKEDLKKANILTHPQLTLVVKQYASKKVTVGGQVNKPGIVAWTDGLGVFEVIQQSGGLTSIADGKNVVLVRRTTANWQERDGDHQRRRHRQRHPAGHPGSGCRYDQGRRPSLLELREAAAVSFDGRHARHAREQARAVRTPSLLSLEEATTDLLAEVPALARIATIETRQLFAMDSSDMHPADWAELARDVHRSLGEYDGVVVVHGTDTMAYTASGVAFLLGPLPKPVVFTGSQRPLAEARTDARENLVDAAVVATLPVPEVTVAFASRVICGVRGDAGVVGRTPRATCARNDARCKRDGDFRHRSGDDCSIDGVLARARMHARTSSMLQSSRRCLCRK